MKLEHPITYADGALEVGNAPILRVHEAGDFPCRDEGKSDEEHQAELEGIAAEVARLAEAARAAGL